MTSRQRLLNAVAFKPTDRVPISTYELVGYNSRSFENNETSYQNIMEAIRAHTDCVCMWDLASDHAAALSAFPAQIDAVSKRGDEYTDTRYVLHTPKGVLTSSRRVYDNVQTTWQTEHWCKTQDDVDAFLSIPFEPLTYNSGDYARVQNEVGDRGIIMASVGDPGCAAMELMDFADATVWAMTEPEHFAATVEEFHRRGMANLENQLKTQTVDLYRIYGPEYFTPPFLPPSCFRQFVTPYVTEMTAMIHRYGGLVRVHSHGRVAQVLDDILSTGADALDPCEAPPDGDITLRALKERAAGRLCLFGNIQLKALEHADAKVIRETVIRCMEDAKAVGGFVIMPTAAPINVPLSPKTEENYRVFIDTALEYGVY